MATTRQRPAPEPDDDEEDAPAPRKATGRKDADDVDESEDEPARGEARSNARPGVLTKRYELPPGCTDRKGRPVRSVVVRELDGSDELQAALWLEQNAPATALETQAGMLAAEQRELIRMSLVEVNDEEVNLDGVPWMGMDQWTIKTFRVVRMYYVDVNAVDDMEIRKSLAGAVVVSGAAPAVGRGRGARGG